MKKAGKDGGKAPPAFPRFRNFSDSCILRLRKEIYYEFCDYCTAAGKRHGFLPDDFCADTAVFHALGAFGCLRAYVKNKALAGSH